MSVFRKIPNLESFRMHFVQFRSVLFSVHKYVSTSSTIPNFLPRGHHEATTSYQLLFYVLLMYCWWEREPGGTSVGFVGLLMFVACRIIVMSPLVIPRPSCCMVCIDGVGAVYECP